MSTRLDVRTGGDAAMRLRDPRVPAALLAVASLVLLVNVVVLFAGAWSIGVTIDEPYHVDRMNNWFATGWYLPDTFMVDGAPGASEAGRYVYGPVAAVVAHAVAVLLGAEPAGTVLATPEAYAARHVAIALISLVGLAAVAAIVRILLRSWRWAVVASAALSAIPAWTGHAMFNIKDTPVAVGYTVLTLGLVALARPDVRSSRRVQAVGLAALVAGSVLAVGTRPGMWSAAFISTAAMLATTWVLEWRGPRPASAKPLLMRRLGLVAGGAAVSWLVLVVTYPVVFGVPRSLLLAVRDSAGYPWDDEILTAGQYLSMPPPPWYLPAWFGAQTPLVVLGLAAVGVAAPLLLLRPRGADLSLGLGQTLVSVQVLALPVGGILTSAVMYDATRQVLFVLPGLAVSAVVGAWLLLRRWTAQDRPWAPRVLAILLGVGLVVPTVTAARLFPYSYTWFNAAAATRPIDGTWMTDYWSSSNREAIPLLPDGTPEACYDWKAATGLYSCTLVQEQQPYWPTRGSNVSMPAIAPGEYDLLMFNRGNYRPIDGCTLIDAVTRPLFWREITMAFTARCAVPLADYPRGGIDLGGEDGLPYLIRGWDRRTDVSAGNAWAYGATAELGFRLPAEEASRDSVLSLDAAPVLPEGAAATTLEVVVNGTPVGTFSYADDALRTVTVPVPGDVLGALGDGRVVVQVRVPADSLAPVDPDADIREHRTFRVDRVTIGAAS